MSETRDNGGAAFPAAWGDYQSGGDYVPGMSLRDWFAGQALTGIASLRTEGFSLSDKDIADWAYKYADAMLKARDEA